DLTTDPTKQREFERMRKTIAKHNLPFEIHEVQASLKNNLLFLILGLGYPLPAKGRLYCTDRMKLEPQKKFEEEYRTTMKILGTRRSESAKRAESVDKHLSTKYFSEEVEEKGRTIKTFMPIVEFTVEDVWGYLAEKKTP
ncbi:phosphoadenosine phosphosulfate reductase domain-containing protein, partial [Paenibacillus chitinolyticus]